MTPDASGVFYVGLDGGGSGCRAVLADATGRVLARATGRPANPRTLGPEAAWQAVLETIADTLTQAGLPPEAYACLHVCLGLAGVGRDADRAAFLAVPQPFAGVRLETDVHIALVGALGAEEGAVLVVGTGSVAYAVDPGGVRHRVGGWGFEVGDEGSGAWLGREAIRAALHDLDGRGMATTLTEDVLAALGGSIEGIVSHAASLHPADYARFAPHVLRAAAAGDGVARRLEQRALSALCLHLRALERRYPAGPVAFTLVGGLAGALQGKLLLQTPDRLRAGYVAPLESPEKGALRLLLTRG